MASFVATKANLSGLRCHPKQVVILVAAYKDRLKNIWKLGNDMAFNYLPTDIVYESLHGDL
ncbi:hypothetical protein N7491_004270 [Penicillium cf. griseofulvum]|uniref:Uncharacterized protein n=1 Tax=Penicillium cf. griseofulvum TaxID=2972120 RepID=A0A9W9IZM0_9EURO|nr:hypothetical protein N7472_006963 [Penicillium cf. griseofulvum]KAJ5423104.1 hypothetical protein N7445_011212 [Penicillium cf. griseofulvum]KAJ5433675.1 hypothetical protein N7491_004270 [Penicillium cf. griseofulvum]